MADEDLAPPEEVKDETHLDEVQIDPVESLAIKAGWSPKENWKGPEEDWKPADQFLEATVAVNRAQRRENKDLTKRLDSLSNSIEPLVDRIRADERAKWEAKHTEAVDLGDPQAAFDAAKELQKLDSKPDVSDATREFVDRNAGWFNIDPLATAMAINAGELLARQGKTQAEQVEYAEKVVRERFPELFKSAEVKPLAQVAEPTGRMAASAIKREKGFNDLPAEARTACLMFEKKGVSRDEFVAEYWKGKA